MKTTRLFLAVLLLSMVAACATAPISKESKAEPIVSPPAPQTAPGGSLLVPVSFAPPPPSAAAPPTAKKEAVISPLYLGQWSGVLIGQNYLSISGRDVTVVIEPAERDEAMITYIGHNRKKGGLYAKGWEKSCVMKIGNKKGFSCRFSKEGSKEGLEMVLELKGDRLQGFIYGPGLGQVSQKHWVDLERVVSHPKEESPGK